MDDRLPATWSISQWDKPLHGKEVVAVPVPKPKLESRSAIIKKRENAQKLAAKLMLTIMIMHHKQRKTVAFFKAGESFPEKENDTYLRNP